MNNKFLTKIAAITMGMGIFDIIMFSEGLVNLKLFGGGLTKSILSIVIILANLIILLAEYKFLTSSTKAKYGYEMDKLKTPNDYKLALESQKSKKSPFLKEIDRALVDVLSAQKKQLVLEEVLEQAKKSEYVSLINIGQEATDAVLNNIRRVLSRIQIADAGEWSGNIEEHKDYINAILDKNDKILNQFGKFLTEVSRMDDPNEFISATEVLEDMTGTLKKIRGEEDEVEKKFTSKGEM